MELGQSNLPRTYYRSVELNNSNAILGDQYVTILPQQESEIEKRSKLFLASVKDPDMNARRNDICDTEFDTFEWMMDNDADLYEKIPNMIQWLSKGSGKFFIQGKAGSGKSTLMKFIFEHEKTMTSVRQWSPSCSLLFHAFWIAGTQGQKTLRGLIASLVFQIIYQDRQRVLELSHDSDNKSCLSDWSTKELSRILITLLRKQSHAYCIFIDGLDEHNDFDIDLLLALIDDLSALCNVKVCLSSRPILHIVEWATGCPMLVLHELTAKDIEAYVKGRLDSKLKSKFADLEDVLRVDHLAQEICHKADGVFIWVYYVMHNVLRGLRIGDDIDALGRRVADLPSEISALYKQMWETQNLDNKVHADEARDMFSYVSRGRAVKFFLFAMLLETELRSRYLAHHCPLGEAFLQKFCLRMKEKITTRCAGLLECTYDEFDEYDEYDKYDVYEETTMIEGKNGTAEAQQVWWRRHQVRYFHRTAYDFVVGSGLAVPDAGLPTNDDGPTCARYIEALIPCFVEEVIILEHRMLRNHCFRRLEELGPRDLPYVEVCMDMINKMVQKLMRDRLPSPTLQTWPMARGRTGLFFASEPMAALLDFSFMRRSKEYSNKVESRWWRRPPHWLLDYLAPRIRKWTRYYRGWVILYITAFVFEKVPGFRDETEMEIIAASLQIISLILQQDADMCTPHTIERSKTVAVSSPASILLSLLVSLVSTSSRVVDTPELQALCRHLKSAILPPRCSVWFPAGYRRELHPFPLDWHCNLEDNNSKHRFTVLTVFASDELLASIVESISTRLDRQRQVSNNTTCPDWVYEADLPHIDHNLPDVDYAGFESKLVSLSQSIRVVKTNLHCHDLNPNTVEGDSRTTLIHRIVHKALNFGYYESDILNFVNSRDHKSGALELSVDPTIGIVLSVPSDIPLLPIDPSEELNMENWKEKGALRAYYAKLTTGQDIIDSKTRLECPAAPRLPYPVDNHSVNTEGLTESASKKRKRFKSVNI